MILDDLFATKLQVLNIGLAGFGEDLAEKGIAVQQVNWRPPVNLDAAVCRSLAEGMGKIQAANHRAVEIVKSATPALVAMGRALDVVPGMTKTTILHAGPPLNWERMCGPMRGAVIGALIYESLATDEVAAQRLIETGTITFAPCHEHSAVGPMAGIISASMPVFIIENHKYGNRAYASMNEGLGKVLRYGAFSADVIERLKWMEDILFPILQQALLKSGAIDLKSIIAQALHMGDEVHNRNRAATSLFYRLLAPHIVTVAPLPASAVSVLNFISGNDHFFLNLVMAAAKASLDPASNIKNSSLVTVMARNGSEFGIQLSATGTAWFTGPAPRPDALFFPGYSAEDANPDIGDSSITETLGLGGFAIAAAPAIVQFVGGSVSDAVGYTHDMYEICIGENNVYQIPYLNFRGTPTGIDAIKVVEKSLTPFIDTGVAHKNPGIGQVGAGVVSAPIEPFRKAVEGLALALS